MAKVIIESTKHVTLSQAQELYEQGYELELCKNGLCMLVKK